MGCVWVAGLGAGSQVPLVKKQAQRGAAARRGKLVIFAIHIRQTSRTHTHTHGIEKK